MQRAAPEGRDVALVSSPTVKVNQIGSVTEA